jgi:hypothetical protein
MIPIAAHSDIRLNPMLDHSNIGLKGNQSDIISDIGLTFLAVAGMWYQISDIRKFFEFLHVSTYSVAFISGECPDSLTSVRIVLWVVCRTMEGLV